MTDRWRFSGLVREGFRNVFARGARLLPVVALAGLFGTGAVALLAVDQRALAGELAALDAQGRGVLTYTALSPERPALIERSSCEALAEQPGVTAAGNVIDIGAIDALPFAVDAQSRRASTTLIPQLSEVDVVIGRALIPHRDRLRVLVQGESLLAEASAPAREGTGDAYTLTFPLRPADRLTPHCMVILDPLTQATEVMATQLAQLSTAGNPITGHQFFRASNDPIADYLSRMSRFVPLALGLVGGFVTGIITRARSSELAVYPLSGTSRASLLTLLLIENLLIAGIAAATATGAALLLESMLLTPTTAITAGLQLAGAWAFTAMLTTLDIPLRRPTDLAKDR